MAYLLRLDDNALTLLASYLSNLEDFLALAASCRRIRSALNLVPARTLLHLTWSSSGSLLPPHPRLLLSALATAIASFAREAESSRIAVKYALWGGIFSLLDFATHNERIAELSEWSLFKVRNAHLFKLDVVDPVTDLIDRCIGAQWLDVPDFWNGGREDCSTLYADPNETLFHLWMYGELFGRGMEDWLEGAAQGQRGSKWDRAYPPVHPSANLSMRTDFLKYVVPQIDVYCTHAEEWSCDYPPSPTAYAPPPSKFHSIRAAQGDRGPYRTLTADNGTPKGQQGIYEHMQDDPEWTKLPATTSVNREIHYISDPQNALGHLLCQSPLWKRLAAEIRNFCGGDFDASWRQEIWEACMWCLGKDGLEMMAQVWMASEDKVAERKERMAWLRSSRDAAKGDPPSARGSFEQEQGSSAGWERLKRMRNDVQLLQHPPRRIDFEGTYCWEFPSLIADLRVFGNGRVRG